MRYCQDMGKFSQKQKKKFPQFFMHFLALVNCFKSDALMFFGDDMATSERPHEQAATISIFPCIRSSFYGTPINSFVSFPGHVERLLVFVPFTAYLISPLGSINQEDSQRPWSMVYLCFIERKTNVT